MKAISNKLNIHESVDLAEFVEATKNYSGADLQGFMYNAHLESIHETLESKKEDLLKVGNSKKLHVGETEENRVVEFISSAEKVMTLGEKNALTEKVCYMNTIVIFLL